MRNILKQRLLVPPCKLCRFKNCCNWAFRSLYTKENGYYCPHFTEDTLKVIISCSKSQIKTDIPVKITELYVSTIAKLKLKFARKKAQNDKNIFIISGTLGLIDLDYEALPYDSKLKLPSVKQVEDQIRFLNIEKDDKILYIGTKKYGKWLKDHFFYKLSYHPDLMNLKGSGHYIQKLKFLSD